MDFLTKSFRKDETLTSWPLLQHICPDFLTWLLNTIAITPKSEDKYVVKVVNWSEFHLSEMTLLQNPYFSWRLKTFIYGLLRAPSVFTFMLWTRLKCKDWKSIVYCTSHCVYLYPQVEEFFFLLLRAAVFRRAPKQHSIEKVVAAKLHFTDNNLAASIYLDARTNTHTKKVPTWETTNRKPRIGLLFTLYACRKKNPQCKIHFVRYPA